MNKSDIKKIYYNGNEITSLYWGGNLIYTKSDESVWNPLLLKGKWANYSTSSNWYCNINGVKTKMPVDATTKEFEYVLSSYLTTCNYFTNGKSSSPSYIERIDNFPDTSQVTSMESMFAYTSVKSIDLSHFNTENVTSMRMMFYDCEGIKEVRMPNLDVSKVTTLYQMFYQNFNNEYIDLANWDISNVTTMDSMFCKCHQLGTINFKNWDFSNVASLYDTFLSCGALKNIIGPISGIKLSFNIYNSPLTNESAMVLINGLSEVEETKSICFSNSVFEELSQEQIALATSKGWSITTTK